MQSCPTRDATLVLRLWQEPHDPRPRAHLVCFPLGIEATAAGTSQILAIVTEALRDLERQEVFESRGWGVRTAANGTNAANASLLPRGAPVARR